MELLITIEKQAYESYHTWEWQKCSVEDLNELKIRISRTIAEIQEWATSFGIVFKPDKPYKYIGDTVQTIVRTKKAGLLVYDIKPLLPELESVCKIKNAQCIVLHMNPLVEQKCINDNVVNLFSLYSFKKLIRTVRKNYKNVKAIVAESWLLDTAIAQRLGFNLLPLVPDIVPWNEGFWGQFIDHNGNVHKKRLDHFIETGTAPYKVRAGYILIKDIL